MIPLDIKATIDGINAAAEDAKDTDYIGADGLITCGICHEPKQTVVQMPWGEYKAFIMCRCRREAVEKQKQAEWQISIAEEREKAFRYCNTNKSKTFATSDKNAIVEGCKRYAENFPKFRGEGKGLILYGGNGTGKTHLACCIANAVIDMGYSCEITSVKIISDMTFGKNNAEEYISDICRKSLLVLDDLLADRDSEYMRELTYQVINKRESSGLPLIVTANVTTEYMKHPPDVQAGRIMSRILKMCYPIHVDGEDRRRKKASEDYGSMREVLGV